MLAGCADGRTIEADHVVLATGYVMPEFVPTGLHRLVSSWALATPCQAPDRLWRERALLWEAGDRYLYARTRFVPPALLPLFEQTRWPPPRRAADPGPPATGPAADIAARLRAIWR